MDERISDRRSALEEELRKVEETFVREMRQRGFEPDQAENVALPTKLAQLYTRRGALKNELEVMKGETE